MCVSRGCGFGTRALAQGLSLAGLVAGVRTRTGLTYLSSRYISTVMGSLQPLREPTFLILTSLAGGPRHGYGILGDVAELSRGRVNLRVGTLYGSLDRLVEEGLVAPDREEVEQGRLRRYYRITGEGRRVLTAEAERLAANAQLASARLGLRRRLV